MSYFVHASILPSESTATDPSGTDTAPTTGRTLATYDDAALAHGFAAGWTYRANNPDDPCKGLETFSDAACADGGARGWQARWDAEYTAESWGGPIV